MPFEINNNMTENGTVAESGSFACQGCSRTQYVSNIRDFLNSCHGGGCEACKQRKAAKARGDGEVKWPS